MQAEKVKVKNTDQLAMERTRLANERTFLAYFRTFIVFLSSGFAIVRLSILEEIREIGYLLLIIAPLMLLIGILRFFYMKRRLRKFFYVKDQ